MTIVQEGHRDKIEISGLYEIGVEKIILEAAVEAISGIDQEVPEVDLSNDQDESEYTGKYTLK